MQYKDFVREMFDKHRGKMSAKDIMKLAAQQWPSVRDGGKTDSKVAGKSKKVKKSRGGALPGLGDISAGLEIANAAMPVVQGLADSIGSLFSPKTSTVIERATAPVPKLSDEERAELVKRIQGRGMVGGNVAGGLKKQKKKTRGGNVGGGVVAGAMVAGGMNRMKNTIPKSTNPLSTFYQFNTLPQSNYSPSMTTPPGDVNGGGLIDSISSLLPLAFF